MKKSFLPLLLLSFISCSMVDHKVEVNVENNSDAAIRDIRFVTNNSKEKVWFDELKPEESASVTVVVKNYDVDGDYTLEYINAEGEKIETSGNYLEEDLAEILLDFNISNDGVTVAKRNISKAKI